MKLTRAHKTALLLFLGLSGMYACLSSGSIAGQGYTGEEIDSGLRVLSVATAWMKGHPVPPMIWARHGLVPILFDLPFLKLGKNIVSPDYMLSFQPCVLTAATVTILFVWLRKLCSPLMSLFLALTAAFGTMLWPYAYISLETKQSLFVFLAGYLALSGGVIRKWPRFLLFSVACGLSLVLKSTGLVLWPVVAYLVYVQFRDDWRERRLQLLVLIAVVSACIGIGRWGANRYWAPLGGGAGSFRIWMIDSPILLFGNVIGLFGSPTKGLLVYTPVALLGIVALFLIFRSRREVAVFTALVILCTAGFVAILTEPTADGWGPRYLHIAIAPLILCIGAAWPNFRWRRDLLLVALAVIGLYVSFLGAAYYYGQRDFAAKATSQNTLEWMNGDSVWNPVAFHARLLHVWLLEPGTEPVMWTPKHIWVWTPPADAMAWKSINLREYSQPQSFLIRFWKVPKQGVAMKVFVVYLSCLIGGVLLLIWVMVRTAKDQHGVPQARELVGVGDARTS
jgi:hypothetical protein